MRFPKSNFFFSSVAFAGSSGISGTGGTVSETTGDAVEGVGACGSERRLAPAERRVELERPVVLNRPAAVGLPVLGFDNFWDVR